MLTHTFVLSSKKIKTWYGCLVKEHTITYRLSQNPFRLYSRFELPKSYELEDYESEGDTWIKMGREYYNLNEFCCIGCRHIPGPMGGAQCASNGYSLIATYQGEIYSVSITEFRPL